MELFLFEEADGWQLERFFPKVAEGPGICHDLFDLHTQQAPLALRNIQVYACHTLMSTLAPETE